MGSNTTMMQTVPQSRSVTVSLSVWVPGPDGAWVVARDAGHVVVDEPVGGARVAGCADLRMVLERAGAGVCRLIRPEDEPQFRVEARVIADHDAPLYGITFWRSAAGRMWVPARGATWTACTLLGPPGHTCA